MEAEVSGLNAEISVAGEDAIRLDGELRRLTELAENSRREAENAAAEAMGKLHRLSACHRRKNPPKTFAEILQKRCPPAGSAFSRPTRFRRNAIP